MTEIWGTEQTGEVAIYVNGRFVKTVASVSPQDIKAIAAENQVRKFTVSGDNDSVLSTADFPVVCGSVHIDEYNEAK